MRTTTFANLVAAVAPLAVLASIAGCGDVASSNDLTTCPCPSSDVCCASGVCAAEEDMCEVTTSRLSQLNKGTWAGYVENYSFLSSSDSLRIVIDVDATGALTASVILGNRMAPPPPDDPEVGWPAGYRYGAHGGLDYVEGFAYPASNVHWDSLRLKMKVATGQAWQQWCGLQTPYFFPAQRDYLCVPPGSSETASLVEPCAVEAQTPIAVECGKLSLCWLQACACDASGCTAADLGADVSLDVSLEGDRGNGSIQLGASSRANSQLYSVRLTRAVPGS